ncbi:unnamed protein product [Pedinophyceae sp. YPF-701]|nr:unnamed protein product [Pedinophyceae sp. YPF-701]
MDLDYGDVPATQVDTFAATQVAPAPVPEPEALRDIEPNVERRSSQQPADKQARAEPQGANADGDAAAEPAYATQEELDDPPSPAAPAAAAPAPEPASQEGGSQIMSQVSQEEQAMLERWVPGVCEARAAASLRHNLFVNEGDASAGLHALIATEDMKAVFAAMGHGLQELPEHLLGMYSRVEAALVAVRRELNISNDMSLPSGDARTQETVHTLSQSQGGGAGAAQPDAACASNAVDVASQQESAQHDGGGGDVVPCSADVVAARKPLLESESPGGLRKKMPPPPPMSSLNPAMNAALAFAKQGLPASPGGPSGGHDPAATPWCMVRVSEASHNELATTAKFSAAAARALPDIAVDGGAPVDVQWLELRGDAAVVRASWAGAQLAPARCLETPLSQGGALSQAGGPGVMVPVAVQGDAWATACRDMCLCAGDAVVVVLGTSPKCASGRSVDCWVFREADVAEGNDSLPSSRAFPWPAEIDRLVAPLVPGRDDAMEMQRTFLRAYIGLKLARKAAEGESLAPSDWTAGLSDASVGECERAWKNAARDAQRALGKDVVKRFISFCDTAWRHLKAHHVSSQPPPPHADSQATRALSLTQSQASQQTPDLGRGVTAASALGTPAVGWGPGGAAAPPAAALGSASVDGVATELSLRLADSQQPPGPAHKAGPDSGAPPAGYLGSSMLNSEDLAQLGEVPSSLPLSVPPAAPRPAAGAGDAVVPPAADREGWRTTENPERKRRAVCVEVGGSSDDEDEMRVVPRKKAASGEKRARPQVLETQDTDMQDAEAGGEDGQSPVKTPPARGGVPDGDETDIEDASQYPGGLNAQLKVLRSRTPLRVPRRRSRDAVSDSDSEGARTPTRKTDDEKTPPASGGGFPASLQAQAEREPEEYRQMLLLAATKGKDWVSRFKDVRKDLSSNSRRIFELRYGTYGDLWITALAPDRSSTPPSRARTAERKNKGARMNRGAARRKSTPGGVKKARGRGSTPKQAAPRRKSRSRSPMPPGDGEDLTYEARLVKIKELVEAQGPGWWDGPGGVRVLKSGMSAGQRQIFELKYGTYGYGLSSKTQKDIAAGQARRVEDSDADLTTSDVDTSGGVSGASEDEAPALGARCCGKHGKGCAKCIIRSIAWHDERALELPDDVQEACEAKVSLGMSRDLARFLEKRKQQEVAGRGGARGAALGPDHPLYRSPGTPPFRGLTFLLTGARAGEGEEVRERVRHTIESRGGVVLAEVPRKAGGSRRRLSGTPEGAAGAHAPHRKPIVVCLLGDETLEAATSDPDGGRLRTPKFMYGMVDGCYMVLPSWVEECHRAGCVLDPEHPRFCVRLRRPGPPPRPGTFLYGVRAYFDNPTSGKTFGRVLEYAGAEVVGALRPDGKPAVDFAVYDSKDRPPPEDLARRARKCRVPLVRKSVLIDALVSLRLPVLRDGALSCDLGVLVAERLAGGDAGQRGASADEASPPPDVAMSQWALEGPRGSAGRHGRDEGHSDDDDERRSDERVAEEHARRRSGHEQRSTHKAGARTDVARCSDGKRSKGAAPGARGAPGSAPRASAVPGDETWVGAPVAAPRGLQPFKIRTYYSAFRRGSWEVAVGDCARIDNMPGEVRMSIVRIRALWSEAGRPFCRAERFYHPEDTHFSGSPGFGDLFLSTEVLERLPTSAIRGPMSVAMGTNAGGGAAGELTCRFRYMHEDGVLAALVPSDDEDDADSEPDSGA